MLDAPCNDDATDYFRDFKAAKIPENIDCAYRGETIREKNIYFEIDSDWASFFAERSRSRRVSLRN